MRLIPSKDKWNRQQFLYARAKQIEAAKESAGPNDIIMEPGDEIVCDICNADIEGDVQLVDYGRMAVCDHCYQRGYAQEKLTYRALLSDGSLGPIVG